MYKKIRKYISVEAEGGGGHSLGDMSPTPSLLTLYEDIGKRSHKLKYKLSVLKEGGGLNTGLKGRFKRPFHFSL